MYALLSTRDNIIIVSHSIIRLMYWYKTRQYADTQETRWLPK